MTTDIRLHVMMVDQPVGEELSCRHDDGQAGAQDAPTRAFANSPAETAGAPCTRTESLRRMSKRPARVVSGVCSGSFADAWAHEQASAANAWPSRETAE
jgi:hypothetical protein